MKQMRKYLSTRREAEKFSKTILTKNRRIRSRRDLSALDRYFPPCGPCAFCGHPDKRHRIWDAIMDSPDPDREVAADFEIPLAAVRLVRRLRPYRRQR